MSVVEHEPSHAVYTNRRCRCEGCREAHRLYVNERQQRRYALRVMVGGRLFAAAAPASSHGKYSTYNNWGCRCLPCRLAKRENDRVGRAS